MGGFGEMSVLGRRRWNQKAKAEESCGYRASVIKMHECDERCGLGFGEDVGA